MSFSGQEESRYSHCSELDGVEFKISDKYKVVDTAFLQQAAMACMTLKDLNKLDEFEYEYEVEHSVLQNLALTLKRQSSSK